MKKHIIIGLSGGVDSSVAALLLKQQGHHVTAVFMKNWEDDDDSEYCNSRQDLIDAASVADRIGIDLEAVNFAKEYKERVFAHFLAEYSAGRTPNPDVLCNSEIKFKAFLDHAMSMGADAIATGHYAGVREGALGYELLMAQDGNKDQSYFLHRLNQAQLSKAVFPLHALSKPQVRAMAKTAELPTFAKKDSTGICFIGERPFRDFLQTYLPKTPGAMLNEHGKIIGEHQGLAYYTLGQRQGLFIGGSKESSGEPWFVAAKDLVANTITVVQGHAHPWLYQQHIALSDTHWICGLPPSPTDNLAAKTRYRMPNAQTHISDDGLHLHFAAPQFAPTPGQYAVLYQDEVCLGGGVIEQSPSHTITRPKEI
jgi:tRNA-specific 2-thiouridylase